EERGPQRCVVHDVLADGNGRTRPRSQEIWASSRNRRARNAARAARAQPARQRTVGTTFSVVFGNGGSYADAVRLRILRAVATRPRHSHICKPLPFFRRTCMRRRTGTTTDRAVAVADLPVPVRRVIRAAERECPRGHAGALRDLTKLAARKAPARGIFDPT